MKNAFKKALITAIALVFVCSHTLLNLTATSTYPTEATPKIQVKVAVGSTALEKTTFLDDLRDALVARGVDFSLLDLAFTASTSFNPADKSLWDFYDHYGQWGEIGVSTSIINSTNARAYLVANVAEFDYLTMYFSYYYSKVRNGFVISYNNGTDDVIVPWPILDTVFADIALHTTNYDQYWYSGIWKTDAQTFLTSQPSGYNQMGSLFYDASLGKSFLYYYDAEWNYKTIEWPDGHAFIDTYAVIDFTNDNVGSSVNRLTVNGNHGPLDNVAFNMYYEFSQDLIGRKHYPEPDSNPDNDNPVDWSNDPHIVTRDNGNVLVFYGYGSPAYKDFMLSKSDSSDRKEITFDLDEDGVDSHSMQGGGFLFNIKTEDDGSGNLLMSGYAILFESSGGIGLYQIDHANVNDFHEETSSNLGEMDGVTLLDTYEKDSASLHSVKITIENNVLNFYDNDIQPIVDLELPEIYGNRFGPLAAYTSHGCSQLSFFTLSNLKMSTVNTVVKTIDQIVDEITWDATAKHYLINLDENVDAGLTTPKIDAIGTKLKAAKAAFIAVGSTSNTSQQNSIISANGGLGIFIPQTDADVIDQIAKYIFAQVHPTIVANIVDIEIAKLGKPYILKAGDSETSVTGNITFLNPLADYAGSTVNWTSNRPSSLSGTGTVTRPSFTSGDIKAIATMAVTFEGLTVTKSYSFTIKKLPITAAEKLTRDLTSLAIVYAEGDSAESVTNNLGFKASLPLGSTVIWSTDKPELISEIGTVVRPAFASGDQSVVISAVVSNGSATSTVTFNVAVLKNAKTEQEKAEEDGNGIIDYANEEDKDNVKTIVELANSGVNGSTITWTSSHPDLLNEKGIVSRPKDGDVEVTLTATIKNGQASVQKTFKVLVKQDATPKFSLIDSWPYLLGLLLIGFIWWFIAKKKKKDEKEA
jgi:LPXTG-motif cell wall-anchored protein